MADNHDHDQERKTGDVGGETPKPGIAEQARKQEGQRQDETGQSGGGASGTGGPGGTGGSVL